MGLPGPVTIQFGSVSLPDLIHKATVIEALVSPMKVDVTLVILSFNSNRYIADCLDAAVDSAKAAQMRPEIFVIDNGSTDGSVETLQAYAGKYPELIHLKLNRSNEGTTVPRNYGLSRARGRYVVVLDSDAYLRQDTLTCLVETLESSEQIGMVVPKLLYPSGNFQKSTDTFPTLWKKAQRLFFLKQQERSEQDRERSGVKEVDYAISACWLLRRAVIGKVGMLDERIFYSPEDVDYCIRIHKAGFKIVYDSSVEMTHDAQEISRRKINRFFFSHMKGLFYLFRKHRYGFIRQSPIA